MGRGGAFLANAQVLENHSCALGLSKQVVEIQWIMKPMLSGHLIFLQ
jgi:hypothetical protein